MTTEVPKHATLIEALAAAQGEFDTIPKSKRVDAGSRKYHYADLAGVLAVVRPVLSRHGIALLQPIERVGEELVLHTWLLGYGETLASSMPLVAQLSNPQALGSVLTYCRRYSLCALVGVAADDDDDDGHEAGQRPPPRPPRPPQEGPHVPHELPRVVPPDDAWLKAAQLKVENADPDQLREWWNSDPQKRQRQDLHKRRADFAEPLAELKARVAARWWECSSLEIQPGQKNGQPDWQRWQGDMARAIEAAPSVAKLVQLQADNTHHTDALYEGSPIAYAAIMAKLDNARLLLTDNETPIDLGDSLEGRSDRSPGTMASAAASPVHRDRVPGGVAGRRGNVQPRRPGGAPGPVPQMWVWHGSGRA